MSLQGISFSTSNTRPFKPITGLLGVSLLLEGNLPVKVQDHRGRGLNNVKITASNPGDTPDEVFTDSQGNALLLVNAANPNPITVEKNKTFKTVNYTGGNSFTIVLDAPEI